MLTIFRFTKLEINKSMAQCKTAVSPLLMHWRYSSFVLSHRNDIKIQSGLIVLFFNWNTIFHAHYSDVIMSAMASQITSLTIIYSIVYWGADQTKYQSSASLAFVKEIHRWPVNSPHKGPVTWKIFPFDDVIMRAFSEHIGHTSNIQKDTPS